jgi:hypothetical protein
MATRPLFIEPPTINPAEYGVTKVAAARMQSTPGAWADEVLQNAMRDCPFLPADRLQVTFKKKDDAAGAAYGFIGIAGAPTVSIPVIIVNRTLKPLDLMIVRKTPDEAEPGVEDQSDRILPLTPENLAMSMDAEAPGQVVMDQELRGTAQTEDGTALRMPMRGRTVVASVGAPARLKARLEAFLAADKTAAAGFLHNGTESVIDAWLGAEAPATTVQEKLASLPIAQATADMLPVEALPAVCTPDDFKAGHVVLTDDTLKTAALLPCIDLANPAAGLQPFLVFDDGQYTKAPAKFAAAPTESEPVFEGLTATLSTGSLKVGSVVSFDLGEAFSAPMRIGRIAVEEKTGSIHTFLTDGVSKTTLILQKGVKQASRMDDAWIIPIDSHVWLFREGDVAVEEPAKVAKRISALYPDEIMYGNGAFSVRIGGDVFEGLAFADEAKTASVLGQWLGNAGELMAAVKEASAQSGQGAAIRFTTDVSEMQAKVASGIKDYELYPHVAAEVIAGMGPLAGSPELAAKLAAAIADPASADAVLSAGFLSEDNIAQFGDMVGTLDDALSDLAKLLLAIRMGFQGDEMAASVALKSLTRVVESLRANTAQSNAVQDQV